MSERVEKMRRQLELVKARIDFEEECIQCLGHDLRRMEESEALRYKDTKHRVEMLEERVQARRREEKAFGWNAALVLAAAIIVLAAAVLTVRADGAETPAAEETEQTAWIEDGRLPGDETPAKGYAALPDDAPAFLGAFTVTHYCICEKCCGKDESHPAYGITKSGAAAVPYETVAVDPAFIPLGSEIIVDYGDGVEHRYRAEDTGSAVKGMKLDVCVSGHEEALRLGVKRAFVWVMG